mgnify:CR=1 FL=1
MKLIIGLGNPGAKYETTRHNVGFLAIDQLIDHFKANGPQTKHQGEVYSATAFGEKILLVKPQTFMNLSGKCVGPLFNFYKCTPEDLIVIHDDVDLNSLMIKTKKGGGTAGHNGLKSINECIGSDNKDYYRIRLGVGKDNQRSTSDWVLQAFSNEEFSKLGELFQSTLKVTELLLQNKITEAMNQFNRKEVE